MMLWRPIPFFFLATALLCFQPVVADDVTWIGEPGVPGDWSDDDHWDVGVPFSEDDVFINDDGIAQVTTDVGTIGGGDNKGLGIGTDGTNGTLEILPGGSLTLNDFRGVNLGVNGGTGTLRINGGNFTTGIVNDFAGSGAGSTGLVEITAGTYTHGPGGFFLGNGGTVTLDVRGTGTYTGGGIVLGFEGATSNISLNGDTASIGSLRNIQSHLGGTVNFNLTPGPSGINPIAAVKTGSENRGKLLLEGDNETLNVDLTDYAFGASSLTLFTHENIRSGMFEAVNITGGDGSLVYDDDMGEIRLELERECTPGTGDIDGNGKVEFADFLLLSANFGQDATQETGDIDCSGSVEFADFLILSANFGNEVAAASSVPEPRGVGIVGMAAGILMCVRRRRAA